MRISRQLWRAIAAVVLVTTSLAACGRPSSAAAPTGAAPVTKLTVAFSEITFTNLTLWVAKEAGIFEKHGLDVDLQQINSSNAIAALLAGQVQVAHAGGSETISADVGGADLEVVGMAGGIYPYWLMSQPNITTPDELRGKKIGVSQIGSSSDIATRVVLRKLGLDPDQDVTIVPVGSTQNRTAALLNGAIDAGLDNPPGALAQMDQGLHNLQDVAALKIPAANVAVVMQKSFVDANKDVVQRYVDSYLEAQARVRSDRAFGVQVLKKYYQSDDDAAMNATYDFVIECMPDDMTPRREQFTDAIDQLATKNPAVRSFDLSKILVTSFVQDAIQRKVGAQAT